MKLILLTSPRLIARASGVSLPLYVALSFENGMVIVVVVLLWLSAAAESDVEAGWEAEVVEAVSESA